MKKISLLALTAMALLSCESVTEKAERLYNEALAEDSLGSIDSKIAKLEESAKLGYGKALFELGNVYCDTTMSLTDSLKSLDYYQKADSMGILEASGQMGVLYMKGAKGIPSDTARALKLLEKAGDNNTGAGYFELCLYYSTENHYDSIKSKKNIDKALELEYPRAYGFKGYELANEGKYNEALALYQKGVELGASNSLCNMGEILLNPHYASLFGIEPDGAKALEYLKKVENEYPVANDIGWIYEKGYGVEKDLAKACYWYEKSAAGKNPVGVFNFGLCLYYGKGCNKDLKRGLKLIKESADLGYQKAKSTYAALTYKPEPIFKNVTNYSPLYDYYY